MDSTEGFTEMYIQDFEYRMLSISQRGYKQVSSSYGSL